MSAVTPLTINQPIPFGRHRDGTYAAARMRQACVAIVGTTGSGKTVTEQCFVAGLVRCPDALPWIIDLSNGGLTNPWLGPWLDGDMRSPVLDWCAFTHDEAMIMTQVALEIIDARRTAYRRLMRQHNTDKIPCTHLLPAIYILLDEGKETTGATRNQQLIRNLITIADKGRAVAVRIIITGLRGTSETIPKEMMADIGARLAMNVAEDNELAHVLGWKVKYNARDFPYPGCGLWRDTLGGAPQRFRSFDLHKPSSIEQIAVASEPWRPQLDEPSAGVPSGSLYAARWERALPLLQGSLDDYGPGPQAQVSPAQGDSAGSVSRPGSPAVSRLGEPPKAHQPGSAVVDLAAVDSAIERARRVIHREQAVAPGRVDAEFERLAARLADDRAAGGEGWGPDGPDGRLLPADNRGAALAALHRLGPGGASGTAVHAALADAGRVVSLSRVYDYLNDGAVRLRHGVYIHPVWRTDQ